VFQERGNLLGYTVEVDAFAWSTPKPSFVANLDVAFNQT
jgi:hypothetical protein